MIITAVLLCFLALAKSQKTCPSSENIRPCSCKVSSGTSLTLSCNRLQSAKQLVKVTTNMKGYTIYSFSIDKSNIGVLPSDAFNNMEIISLGIKNSNLTKLGSGRNQPPFLGLENSLQSLEIKNSFLDEHIPLATLSLSHLKKLESLRLHNNLIPTIGNNWFENGPYSLRSLYIMDSNASVVGSHAFEALDQIEYFALSGSLISKITRDMFPMPANSLVSLNLSKNKLSFLPDDIFTKMPSLKQLTLHSNYISTINEVVFAPIWSQLEYADFHGNPITCDKEMEWIFKYRLPENFNGYCMYPTKLQNKSFKSITLSDLED